MTARRGSGSLRDRCRDSEAGFCREILQQVFIDFGVEPIGRVIFEEFSNFIQHLLSVGSRGGFLRVRLLYQSDRVQLGG